MRIDLDVTDISLLNLLQRNGQARSQDLGDRLHLSASQISRRRQRLERDGVIQGYAAQLDPSTLGLAVQAFVQVQLERHGAQEGRQFSQLLESCSEVVSAWTMTGDSDYLLRIYCADLKALNRLLHEILLAHPLVARVHSQIVMDQTKSDAPLPIG